jgi:hypothetical protein
MVRSADTLIKRNTPSPTTLKRKNHQNSDREATPENVTYFLKHVVTAVGKFKGTSDWSFVVNWYGKFSHPTSRLFEFLRPSKWTSTFRNDPD